VSGACSSFSSFSTAVCPARLCASNAFFSHTLSLRQRNGIISHLNFCSASPMRLVVLPAFFLPSAQLYPMKNPTMLRMELLFSKHHISIMFHLVSDVPFCSASVCISLRFCVFCNWGSKGNAPSSKSVRILSDSNFQLPPPCSQKVRKNPTFHGMLLGSSSYCSITSGKYSS